MDFLSEGVATKASCCGFYLTHSPDSTIAAPDVSITPTPYPQCETTSPYSCWDNRGIFEWVANPNSRRGGGGLDQSILNRYRRGPGWETVSRAEWLAESGQDPVAEKEKRREMVQNRIPFRTLAFLAVSLAVPSASRAQCGTLNDCYLSAYRAVANDYVPRMSHAGSPEISGSVSMAVPCASFEGVDSPYDSSRIALNLAGCTNGVTLPQPPSVSPQTGYTMLVQAWIDPSDASQDAAYVTATDPGSGGSGLLFSIGRNATNWLYGRNMTGHRPDFTDSAWWLHPWDPVTTPKRWQFAFYTFQPDGKLRIDVLDQDVSTTSSLQNSWNWQAGLVSGGRPQSSFPQGQLTAVPTNSTYLELGQLVLGRFALGYKTPAPAANSFGGLTIFNHPLTRNEILGYLSHITFPQPASIPLQIGQQPCNTGLYLNGVDTVNTPCGIAPASPSPRGPVGSTLCAAGGGVCSGGGSAGTPVAYGLNGVYSIATVPGGTICGDSAWWSKNPQPNWTSECYAFPVLAPLALPSNFIRCAALGGTCAIPNPLDSPSVVVFGSPFLSRFVSKPVSGASVPCNASAFPFDPAPDFPDKACWIMSRTQLPAPPPGGFQFCANDYDTCTTSAVSPRAGMVAYGAAVNFPQGGFRIKPKPTNSAIACKSGDFFDPSWLTAGSCSFLGGYNDLASVPGWLLVAREGERYQTPGGAYVAYGAGGDYWIQKRGSSADFTCNAGTFGGTTIPNARCYIYEH